MDLQRLVITRPSGNITAIVFDEIAPEDMRETGSIIQSEYPSVEQVLFVQKNGDAIHGQMAGGEFCGNAARSLGYVLADGRESTQTFIMSGLSTPVSIDVKADSAKLKLQTSLEYEKIILGNAHVPVVHLEGISHAILLPEHPLFHFLKEYAARPDRWNTVKHVLDDLGLADRPASGLIFAEQDGGTAKITPYVFVRDIETLYAETACASGSIAVASLLGSNSIHQPSGKVLQVMLTQTGNVIKAEVNGNISIICDGPVTNLYGVNDEVERGTILRQPNLATSFPSARAG